MFTKKSIGLLLAALLVVVLGLAACQPQTQTVEVEVTRVVTETVTEEGVEVTRVITEEVVVTATPEPEVAPSFVASDPATYVHFSGGDADTIDPALAYDTTSGSILMHIYETLITYNHTDPTTFVPALAMEVPSLENGGISEDGQVYTFNIRPGVSFHGGQTLEPSDVAYSFQRGLLQSDPNGPQWLLIEPIMGYTSGDITEGIQEGAFAGDPEALIGGATPEELAATCEAVKAAIVADDAAGTVTFNLAQPWGPFLATIANTWGSVIDYDWAVEQGDWDGDCATWQNFYAVGPENSKLTAIANGTGPFVFDHWTPGEEWVFTSNENYWRTEETPLWEGGPFGPPAIKTFINRIVPEWGTRFAALQAGDADSAGVDTDVLSQADEFVGERCDYATLECAADEANPDGPLQRWADLPATSRQDMFLTWNINPDSPYVGSGALDGQGIPLDFFSDINVRKAMATCVDYETYISDALSGNGVRNNGPIILDMLGYNPDGPIYEYNPEECAAYLEQAWDGALPETGFRFQVAFSTGSTSRQTLAEMLQAELAAINPLYVVETVGMPWPTYLRSFRSSLLPIALSGWAEDIHDPHNWVVPYTTGTYGGRQGIPEDVLAQFGEINQAAVLESDPAAREALYFQFQQLWYDLIPTVILAQSTGNRFQQRWVEGYYYNPILPGTNYYGMSKATE